ncbi:MAG TPA: lipase secretion chaperone [Gammaproteobacteria bacterium]|nr:lipase secretion chaperone [Gammaproteobacteria bacterium]
MRKSVLIFGLAAAAVIAGMVYWALPQDEIPVSKRGAIQDQNTETIAYKWRWENLAKTKPAPKVDGKDSEVDKARPAGEMPYDAVAVYRVLQSIKLDENGRLVPDQTAMQALEKGYSELGPNLSPEAMSELQKLIRAGLPGPAGEEAALILENYYRFRSAEVEFNQQRESQTPMAESGLKGQLPTVDRYEELVQLRRSYLGKETADSLFAVEDAQARHMFAAIAIQQNTNLTAEEKQAQQEALQEQLNERLLALGQVEPQEAAAEKVQRLRETGATSAEIYSTREAMLGAEGARELAMADQEEAQWQRRFNGFWQARRYVMQAGLDETERERQIEQLLNQYFSPEERDRARATSSEWQAQDPQ